MGLLDLLSSLRQRADRFLNEKNVVTDFLGKVEEKTGIKKKLLAGGQEEQEEEEAAGGVVLAVVASLC